MDIPKICNRIIEYSYYALFLFVPLFFWGETSELFEFNKMWLTFALTLIILASWITKSIASHSFRLQRTPLDIPILLFLLSQIISTIFSLDTHVSLWGYYSRFNGGLLSILSYIFLYYAFVSNASSKKMQYEESRFRPILFLSGVITAGFGFLLTVGTNIPSFLVIALVASFFLFLMAYQAHTIYRIFYISLLTGIFVALWGLPSHFGYDPTCLLLRGSFDVSCWVEAFQPKVRIFSTLGQPNWMAAYLSVLLPISMAFLLRTIQTKSDKITIANISVPLSKRSLIFAFGYLLLIILFYVDILYTRSQSGFLGFVVGTGLFILLYFFEKLPNVRNLLVMACIFLIIAFFVGQPIVQFNKFTFNEIKNTLSLSRQTNQSQDRNVAPAGPALETGGTESGKIRGYVWRGAIDVFLHNPLFGTGVETFAFAYYKYKPQGHNLTSEWDYLYNKAHNEYLNYLATTGLFGLITYLSMIVTFLWSTFRILRKKQSFLITGLTAGYVSLLVSNFLGFSVVIVNLYLFLIPAFVFIIGELLEPRKAFALPAKATGEKEQLEISLGQWAVISLVWLTTLYLLITLFRFWRADQAYALGNNLDKVGQYQQGYPKLNEAVSTRGDEPTFQDEFSVNNAILASAFWYQQDATSASQLAQTALALSDKVTKEHPNNVVFWKTRVRTLYTLAQIDAQFLLPALDAIKKATELAPTDAKISYNLGLLYGQNGDSQKAVETLRQTIKLKPDYRDAYYALGLFYRDLAVNKNNVVIKPEMQEKAVETMHYILDRFNKEDAQAIQSLKSWGEL